MARISSHSTKEDGTRPLVESDVHSWVAGETVDVTREGLVSDFLNYFMLSEKL